MLFIAIPFLRLNSGWSLPHWQSFLLLWVIHCSSSARRDSPKRLKLAGRNSNHRCVEGLYDPTQQSRLLKIAGHRSLLQTIPRAKRDILGSERRESEYITGRSFRSRRKKRLG